MKCEGCPLICECCKGETGEGFWCPSQSPDDCHLTPATFPLINRLLTGEILEQERVVLEAIGRGEWDCYTCKHGEWDTQVVTMQRRYFCEVWNIPNDPDMDMILRPCAAFEPKEQA